MTFRTRLLLILSLLIAATAALVSYSISVMAARAFERIDQERTKSLIAQINREFAQRSQEVTRRIESIAGSEPVLRMAAEMAKPDADPAPYLEQAAILAKEQALDFLELIGPDGAIISSAQYPARFGYKKEWVAQSADWKALGAFVELEELPEEQALALLAVRALPAAGRPLYVVGGQRIDKGFLDSLATPQGMKATLVRDPAAARQMADHAIPLQGRKKDTIATLLLSSTREELRELTSFIRLAGAGGALGGIVLAVAFGWWATRRVTRPVQTLAAGAREVASGNWNAHVEVTSRDEIGDLAQAFNQMTRQLVEQRDRLIQVERVAAWRELARRLAHELKNPLFPMQITVENLQRARQQHPDQFDEVFSESTQTLLAELSQLKSIVGRFSDFAKMPAPKFEQIRLAEFLPPLIRLFEPQWTAPGHKPIQAQLDVADPNLTLTADHDQLTRALRNLILNAMDAMPHGGTIQISARREKDNAILEVSDTGAGLTQEECERLFTPYYTTKHHGTGLGLAIVQSVVSDHGGKITVESEPGHGATFRIELPCRTS